MNVVDSMYNCIDSRLDSGFPQKNLLEGLFWLHSFTRTCSFTCLQKNNHKVTLNPALSRLLSGDVLFWCYKLSLPKNLSRKFLIVSFVYLENSIGRQE